MQCLLRISAIIAVAGVTLHPAGVRARVPAAAPRAFAASVAVSLRGSIVLFVADGSGRTALTHSGKDHAPVVAPNGRSVAFWRGAFVPSRATQRQIMVATSGGRGRWHVTPFSLHEASAAGWQQTLVWGPGSRAVAWLDGATVKYRRLGQPQRVGLRLGARIPAGQNLALAFTRDGGTLASTLPTAGTGLPHTLRVAVRRLDTARQKTITITFRSGLLIGRNGRGSVPVTDDLSYTDSPHAPPGHTLEFATVGAPGIGRQMTGIFLVPDTGGRARLVQGTGQGLHAIPPFGYGMNGATHFQTAPNGRYIATDPTEGFYVAGETGPFHVSAPTPNGCVLSQWTWLADSVHLAYVTECTVPGSSPILFRLTLTTVSVHGGVPVVLYRTVASNPNAIDLAPVYRCVACG